MADGNGGSATATVTVTVTGVNDGPVAVDDAATTAEDTAVSVTVLTNDSDLDGDTLAVSSVSVPAHGTAVIAGTSVLYTPALNYNGPDSFTYTVGDSNGGSATATVSVTVTGVNDGPVAVDDAATTAEDTAVSVTVLTNDSDLDGDTLSIATVSTPAHGTAVIAGTGITYTPALNYNGADSFTYTVGDGSGGSATATVTVTVTGVNDGPVAVDDAATTAEDTAVSVTVLTNDTDLDGDTLAVSTVSTPAHGTAVIAGTSVTYTPAANYNGNDSFSYTIADANGGTATATVTVTVTGTNDAPVAVDDAATTAEDTPVSITVLSNDSDLDGDTLSVTLSMTSVTPPTHGTTVVEGSAVLYTPAVNYKGNDSFSYAIADGHGGTATATVTVTVTGVNDGPVAVEDAATTPEDTATTVAVLTNDTDLDGDTLSVTSVGTPAHGTAVIAGTSVTYTPAANYNGPDSFTYTIGDGNGGSATATVTVTVTGVNDGPVAVDDAATTAEDTAASITVLTNDTDLDGDTLAVSSVSAPAHGTAVIAGASVTYTPAANYNGPDSFTYTIGDGSGGSATATVTVTVTSTNDAPVAADDAATTAEDTAVSIAVLANDSDFEGDTLSVTSVTTPAHGTAVLEGSAITYTPVANYNGNDSFTYTLSDGIGGTATAIVTVATTSANDAPVAVDDAATTPEDVAVSIAVLPNDNDIDGDSLSVTSVTPPAHGTAAINVDGKVSYTPAGNYNGPDSFTYTVGDGQGGSATATVDVTVTATNDGPVAVNDAATTTEDTAVSIAVLANDTDLEGDSLTVDAVTTPAHGVASINPDRTITYVPAASYDGADSFSYTIGDGHGGTAVATISVMVTAVNHAPSADNQSVMVRAGTPAPIALSAHDVDGDTLTYTVSEGPAHGALSGTAPNLIYTPGTGYVGTDSFTFIARDADMNSPAATVQLDVRAAGRAPEAEDQWMIIDEDTTVEIKLSAGDPDGDPLTFVLVTPPSHGTLSGTLPNVVYTPDPDFEGEDRFTFRASDGFDSSNLASVDLWIWGVNDSPVVSPIEVEVGPDGSVDGQLQAVDPEGDWIFYWITSEPTRGTVTFDPMTGQFTYVASPQNPGPDSFTYTVYDSQTQGNDATVQVDPGIGGR